MSFDRLTSNQIDYIVINCKHVSCVLDVHIQRSKDRLGLFIGTRDAFSDAERGSMKDGSERKCIHVEMLLENVIKRLSV